MMYRTIIFLRANLTVMKRSRIQDSKLWGQILQVEGHIMVQLLRTSPLTTLMLQRSITEMVLEAFLLQKSAMRHAVSAILFFLITLSRALSAKSTKMILQRSISRRGHIREVLAGGDEERVSTASRAYKVF